MNENSLHFQANDFLEKVFKELNRNNFTLEEHWHIDHLCYRTSTQEHYLLAKEKFEKFSKLLIESEVNGRLISTFKLAAPIIFGDWEIDLIEVPAPKKGKVVVDGFEHFEVVSDLDFDEIKSRYKDCKFDESGLAKEFNQELEILFDGFAIKFHPLSLESVINLEINEPAFSALKKSNVLKYLKAFSPLVAGTFPLNMNVVGSDIDILISTGDFALVKKILHEKFGDEPNFKYEEMTVHNEQTLVASFAFQGIDFEIFGQKIKSIKQQGYLHFLIEERLLKIGGSVFAEKVKEARKQGLKTEPAFAKVLKLSGDPYEELLTMQKKSYQDLKKKVRTDFW